MFCSLSPYSGNGSTVKGKSVVLTTGTFLRGKITIGM